MTNSKPKRADAGKMAATISRTRPGDFELGSLESRVATRMLLDSRALGLKDEQALTDLEQAMMEATDDAEVRIELVRLVRVAEKRAEIFGHPLPTPEEIRGNQRVAREIDRITDGNEAFLAISNPVEWNRVKSIVLKTAVHPDSLKGSG